MRSTGSTLIDGNGPKKIDSVDSPGVAWYPAWTGAAN